MLKGSSFLMGSLVRRVVQQKAQASPQPESLLLSPSSHSAPWVQPEKTLPLAFQKNFLSWTLSFRPQLACLSHSMTWL